MTTSAAASHSATPMTFSGNSSAAEIHLQIYSVSHFCACTSEALMGCCFQN